MLVNIQKFCVYYIMKRFWISDRFSGCFSVGSAHTRFEVVGLLAPHPRHFLKKVDKNFHENRGNGS